MPGRPVGSVSIGSTGVSGVGSVASAGSVGAQQFELIARNLFTVTDDFQLTRGAHVLSVGVWFQRVQSNDDAANQRNSSHNSRTSSTSCRANRQISWPVNPHRVLVAPVCRSMVRPRC